MDASKYSMLSFGMGKQYHHISLQKYFSLVKDEDWIEQVNISRWTLVVALACATEATTTTKTAETCHQRCRPRWRFQKYQFGIMQINGEGINLIQLHFEAALFPLLTYVVEKPEIS